MNYNSKKTKITFWGVRGSTPCANIENMCYGGNTTCVQVEIPGSDEILILDCGTGIRNLGNTLLGNNNTLCGRIFITHPHWDHIQGFPFFEPIYDAQNHFEIHMPGQAEGCCREILSGHLAKTYFPITLDMIDANLVFTTQPSKKVEYNGFAIEFMLANHPINTAIYKLHIADKTIIFSPDNELNPHSEKNDSIFYTQLKKFFKHADILIHDAQYNSETYRKKRGWGHSAWEEAVDFAHRSGVRNLYLTHHDPDSDDAILQSLDAHLKKEYSNCFESIQLVKEGTQILI